jgi:hypothetical protein
MSNVNTTIQNGSEYKSITVKAGGNLFSFLQVTGKSNYIAVRKETNNPGKGLGKEFKAWADVEKAYKSPSMQIAILCAQSSLMA